MPSQMSRLTYGGEVGGEIGDPEKYRIYSAHTHTQARLVLPIIPTYISFFLSVKSFVEAIY